MMQFEDLSLIGQPNGSTSTRSTISSIFDPHLDIYVDAQDRYGCLKQSNSNQADMQ